ncbi:hypothetical protein KAR91_09135 [Candidatus Pacearchaeota archaeon]|nr:hypothetical protein [Candidatus Pacearchaeota archaeon]
MAKTPLPIDTGFYVDESLPLSAQQCINWYIDIPQADTVTNAALKPTPGKNQLTTVSTIDPQRGAMTMASTPFFVIGSKLYSLDRTIDAFGVETFSTTAIGTITGSGLVSMANNGTQLVVVIPGSTAFVFDTSGPTFSEITDATFVGNGPYDSVEFIDGFFVFTQTSGKSFVNSPLNDATGPYNALDIATAEADPDNIRGQINFRNSLYILGSETTEVFENQALDNAPFVRINGFLLPKGLAAKFSIVESNNTFAFIGAGKNESPAVWMFTGNNFQKISTTPIDNVLSKLTDTQLDVVFGWSYAEAGAYFIGFTLPGTTFVYDFTTNKWTERKSTVASEDVADRAASMITGYGRVLVGDTIDGRIGELKLSIVDEYDTEIKRTNTTKAFDSLGESVRVASIEAVMETGVGNSTVPDPKMRMSFSDDGGRSFNNERTRSIGKVGKYDTRAIWRRNGRFSRSRILKFEYSEKARTTFIKLEANIA